MRDEFEWMRRIIRFMDELAQQLASNNEPQANLDWIVGRVSALMKSDEACIRLSLVPSEAFKTRGYRRASGAGSWPDEVSITVMGFLLDSRDPLVTRDLLHDARFPGLVKSDAKVRSAVAAPLLANGRTVGCLAATQTQPGRKWSESEVRTLVWVARHTGPAIERMIAANKERELKTLRQEERRRAEENRQAAELQQNALPRGTQEWQGWRAHGRVVPAEDVGGDAFDFHPIGTGRLGVAVADVEGKGGPAAYLMMAALAQIREASAYERPIQDIMASIEHGLAAVHSRKAVTLAYGEIDLSTGVLDYHLAGHPWPLIRRVDGTIEELKHGAVPFGWGLPCTRDSASVEMRPGDALLLYSDGVLDAMDSHDQLLGMERLEQLWQSCAGLDAEESVQRIHQCVRKYCEPRMPEDDVTVAVVTAPVHG